MTNFFESIQPTLATSLLTDVLDFLVDTGSPLETMNVFLFTAGPSPITRDSLMSDYTLPAQVGLTPQTVTWYAFNVNLPSNLGKGKTAHVSFSVVTLIPPGEVIIGYGIANNPASGSDPVLMAEIFPNPVSMGAVGDMLSIDIVVPIANKVQVQ